MFPPKKFLPLCAAALIVLGVLPWSSAQGRERVRFDDGWKFHLLDASVGEPPGAPEEGAQITKWRWQAAGDPTTEAAQFSRVDFDDSHWTEITSAHQVIRKENSFAWFRTVLAKPPGTHPVMHFNSVDDTGTVFLNGQKLPTPENWNDSFDVPLGAAWNSTGPNVLTVLVENNGGLGGMDEVYLRTEAEPALEPSSSGPPAPVFDDAGWRSIHLPHDFVVEGTFDPKGDSSHGFLPKTAGWYRKHFRLPEGDKDKVLWLEFDGVYRDSMVWLNGVLLGRHASGYTSFYYDISKAAHPGGDNVLSVWVDARHSEGWWYEGGGIYRHVYLTKLAPTHVAHWGEYVTATPAADFQTAEVAVETDMVNEGPGAVPVGVDSKLLDADGKVVGSTSMVTTEAFAPSAQAKVSQRLSLPAPKLWTPETPYLYTLETTVRRGDEVLDQIETRVGVRSLRWDKDHGFFLNGKPFKIQGTCNHQDFAGIGIALPDHVHDYRVSLLKEMGSNAYRFSHQPMAPELLDACDRLGMLVMDENRKLGDTPEIIGQVESLVRRDRNHPSVFLWSMCNEEPNQGRDLGAKMFTALKNEVLKWDKTRPVTCAMNGGIGQGISLVEDLQGFNYNIDRYDGFRQDFPQQPAYGSETASETTTRGIYADDKQKCYVSVYRDLHERAWKPIAESDWLAGAFVWTGFDYRGEPDPYKWPCINSPMGFMDTCGFPKDSYYYYRSQWSRAPLAHILPHWNWPGKEGQEMAVQVTGNAVKYDLLLNGVSLGVKEMPPHSHIDWRVKYVPGTLETRGYNGAGEQIVADKVETTGKPTQLQITPDRDHFLADGEDVVIVRCAVLDAQGRVVPTASDAVTFSVEGPAAIDGVGNGNPSDLTPDKGSRRNAFNGYCLAVVQSTGESGTVTLTATSPGLSPAKITVRAGVAGVPATAPAVSGLNEHDFFYAGEAKTQDMYIVRKGQIAWSYHDPVTKGEISDAVMLSNGNILFAHQFGVTLISPEKKVLWNLDAPPNTEIHTAQPIGTERVLYVQNGAPAKVVVVNIVTGQTEKEFPLPVRNPRFTHGQFRHARLTPAGTLLVAHMDLDKVCEYDSNGAVVWSVDAPVPWSAARLATGNTLICGSKLTREVNLKGETVWELTAADVPGYRFDSRQIAVRLANGNTLVNQWLNSWNDKADPATVSAQAFEFTPDKKIAWILRSWEDPVNLGPPTTIQRFDEPGVPEAVHFGDIR